MQIGAHILLFSAMLICWNKTEANKKMDILGSTGPNN